MFFFHIKHQILHPIRTISHFFSNHFPRYDYPFTIDNMDKQSYQRELNNGYPIDIIVEQKYIPATSISMDALNEGETSFFPWHGYSEEQFDELNSLFVSTLVDAQKCSTVQDTTRFLRKNKLVYEQYYSHPIHVTEDSPGHYILLFDGRHRVYAAQKAKNIIPVFVVDTVAIETLTLNDYVDKTRNGPWNFLS